MIWYDMIVVWSTYGTVSRQHIQLQLRFQFPLWVFSVAIARPKSMSMGGFDFQRRSMKQSTFNWISQADPIDMIDTSLSVSGEKLNKAQWTHPPSCNIVSKSPIRWDNPSPSGCFASHLVKECNGVAEKREGVGGTVCHGPKMKKKTKTMIVFLARAKSPELSSILGRTTITTPVCKCGGTKRGLLLDSSCFKCLNNKQQRKQ